MFNIGQRTAVAGAFKLAGYVGDLVVAPVVSEDERAFLMEPQAYRVLYDVRVLEQIVGQILGRKVFIVERTDHWDKPIPFE